MRSAAFSLGVLLAGVSVAFAQDETQRPRLMLREGRLAEIRAAIEAGDPVFVAARDQVVRDADGYLARDPEPVEGALAIPGYYTSERETQRALTRRVRGDAYGAHSMALAYRLTGDERYAVRAKEYLFAWVEAGTYPEDAGHWSDLFRLLDPRGDTGIVVTYSFPNFFYAFDLLDSAGQLTEEERGRYREWLGPFVEYLRCEEFFRNNHHNWQVLFLLTASVVLEDEALREEALGFYRSGLRVQVATDGSMWRELVRGERAGTYTLMALEAMVQTVWIAEGLGEEGLRDFVPERRRMVRHGPRVRRWENVPCGTLQHALDHLVEFLHDPEGWRAQHATLIRSETLRTPGSLTEWGYVFEMPLRWWGEERYREVVGEEPYGLTPGRCYTLSYATLYVRARGAEEGGIVDRLREGAEGAGSGE